MTLRSEEEVDAYIEDLISRTKGTYITQGVSFNKTSTKQLRLLKLVLLECDSFSGFIKELLTLRYHGGNQPPVVQNQHNIEERIDVVKNNANNWV